LKKANLLEDKDAKPRV